MMISIFIFLCVIAAQVQCGSSKLIMLQVLFRHGDRSPRESYPTDPNPKHVWPEGLGKLTQLGRKQHYALGKLLRWMYQGFVTSNPNEVTVYSTHVDRSLKSAQCNIASFYAPTPEWSFESDLPWQPITIQYTPVMIDRHLSHDSECPEADAELKRISESKECQKLVSDHKEMLENLSFHSGMNLSTVGNTDVLYDILSVEKKYNLIIPWWVEPYWNELSDFYRQSLNTCKVISPLLQSLRMGPFMEKLIEDMKKKIAGHLSHLKVRVHSAHEKNIRTALSALKLYNEDPPPYCATILFELHEMNIGQHAVRLLYLNSTTPENVFQEPHVLILEGCNEYCPLDYFINLTKNIIPDDWHKECKIDRKSRRKQSEKLHPYV